MDQPVQNDKMVEIELNRLKKSPWQGRFLDSVEKAGETPQKHLAELSASIEKSGLMQPIIVRESADGYETIDGHRRALVFNKLGRKTIPAIVKSVGDRDAQLLSIVGNLQRRNLKPLELAVAYRKALSSGLFSSQRELSASLGKHESFVGDILNTLNMDRRILDDLEKNETISDIRVLRAIRRAGPVDSDGVSEEQYKFYLMVIDNKLSREDVIAYVKSLTSSKAVNPVRIKVSGNGISIRIQSPGIKAKDWKKLLKAMERKIEVMAKKAVEHFSTAAKSEK